jgi:Ni,Fe-hydrogenase I large subunit
VATGDCTLDRHAARALECFYVAQQMQSWFDQLDPSQPVNIRKTFDWGAPYHEVRVPFQGTGYGLTEAPRGALGHWIKIGLPGGGQRGKVTKYQIITPTAWNVSPRDSNGNPGPIEESISGTYVADVNQPVEVMRVAHAFDACIACTVHVSTPKKGKVAKAEVRTGI